MITAEARVPPIGRIADQRDVTLASLVDGQSLVWDNILQKWKNATPSPTVTPAGSSGYVQYNNAGVLGGAANLSLSTDRARVLVGGATDDSTNRLQVAGDATLTGSLGIGTALPGASSGAKLDVQNSGIAVQAKFGDVKPFYLIANDPNLGFNAYYNLGWKYGAGSVGSYGGVASFAPATGQFVLYASGAAGNANAAISALNALVTVNANGGVGIGTSPAAGLLLDVAGKGQVYDSTPTTGVSKLSVRAGAGQGSNKLFEAQDNASGAVLTSIDGSGNVGIGVTTPLAALHAVGAANTNSVYVKASNTTNQSYGANIDAGTSSTDYALLVRSQAGTTDYFRIRGDGSVVLGPSASPNLAIDSTGEVSIKTIIGSSVSGGWTVTAGGISTTPIAINAISGQVSDLLQCYDGSFSLSFATKANGAIYLKPLAAAPSLPTLGTIYVGSDGHAYLYNGSAWKQLDN